MQRVEPGDANEASNVKAVPLQVKPNAGRHSMRWGKLKEAVNDDNPDSAFNQMKRDMNRDRETRGTDKTCIVLDPRREGDLKAHQPGKLIGDPWLAAVKVIKDRRQGNSRWIDTHISAVHSFHDLISVCPFSGETSGGRG